jgi:hypothetical protein
VQKRIFLSSNQVIMDEKTASLRTRKIFGLFLLFFNNPVACVVSSENCKFPVKEKKFLS